MRNDDEKRDASARFVLGLGCVDVMNIGFEKIEEIDDFAARVRKVPGPRKSCNPQFKEGEFDEAPILSLR